MGRTFVTFAEAAQMLKRSVRTVHTYVDKGLIRREYCSTLEGTDVVLSRADVEQLASEQGANLPALNNKTLVDIQGRLRAMEMKMAVFQKMNGLEDREPLRPNPENALGLVEAAKQSLTATTFQSEEVHLWVDLFMRMDEVTFELIRKAGAASDYWQPIFNLCLHFLEFAADPKRCKDSRIWFLYHMELTQCLKHLRSIILVWIESGKGSATATLRQHLGRGRDDLVRRLTTPNSN